MMSNKKVIRNQDGAWNVYGKILKPTNVIDHGGGFEINIFKIDEGKKIAVPYTKPTRFVGTPFELEK